MNAEAESQDIPDVSGLLRVTEAGEEATADDSPFGNSESLTLNAAPDGFDLLRADHENAEKHYGQSSSDDEDGFKKLRNNVVPSFDEFSNASRLRSSNALNSSSPSILPGRASSLTDQGNLRSIDAEMDGAALRNWSSLFQQSRSYRAADSLPKYPWERGFAALVFSKNYAPTPWEKRVAKAVEAPRVPYNLSHAGELKPDYLHTLEEQASKTVEEIKLVGSWATVAHRLSTVDWQVSSTYEREAAMTKWKHILQAYPERSDLGRKLLKDIMILKSDDYLIGVISDVFSIKATLTLHKRANSIIKYFLYCDNTSRNAVPVVPAVVYLFTKTPQMQKPSAPQALREALNFAGSLLGLDGAIEAANDPLVAGAAGSALLKKRIRKQSKLFVKRDLKRLLKYIRRKIATLDKVFLGQCFFLLTLRSRWSDGQHVDVIIEDFVNSMAQEGGYLQANTTRHKTATSAAKKKVYLEMAGPVAILGDVQWYEIWMDARNECGLGRVSDPMVPVVGKDGLFGKEPLSAGEASVWLQDIMKQAGCESTDHTTHCLKGLYLSWAAKFNIPYDDRSILGYHVIKGRESLFCYARDNMSGPLRALDEMLAAVESGDFDPDLTRSGRFRKAPRTDVSLPKSFAEPKPKRVPGSAFPKPSGVKIEPIETALEVSSSSDSHSSTDSDDDSVDSDGAATESVHTWEQAVGKGGRRPARSGFDDSLVFHAKRLTVHKKHASDEDKTACGKDRTSAFSELDFEPQFDYPRCRICFGQQ